MTNIRKFSKNLLGDNLYWKIKFYYFMKFWPNINKPRFFNEKVRWRMLYDQNYLYVKCADKYQVRNYVEKKIGAEYLIPLRYSFDSVDEINSTHDFRECVAKSNHGAGMVEFVEENYNLDELVKIFNRWMEQDYTSESNELHYSRIPRKILIEESLCVDRTPPIDYKFHTFKQTDGSYNFVLQLVNGRFANESRGYYLNNLDECVWHHGEGKHQIPSEHREALKEAIKLSQMLCEDFNYVRVDWYVFNNKPYFGELTFTPGAASSYEFGVELERKMSAFWQL